MQWGSHDTCWTMWCTLMRTNENNGEYVCIMLYCVCEHWPIKWRNSSTTPHQHGHVCECLWQCYCVLCNKFHNLIMLWTILVYLIKLPDLYFNITPFHLAFANFLCKLFFYASAVIIFNPPIHMSTFFSRKLIPKLIFGAEIWETRVLLQSTNFCLIKNLNFSYGNFPFGVVSSLCFEDEFMQTSYWIRLMKKFQTFLSYDQDEVNCISKPCHHWMHLFIRMRLPWVG